MTPEFQPRYPGHEPPQYFHEIRAASPEPRNPPPTPIPMTGRELRAAAGRAARTAAAQARKAACLHPKWSRVYADKLAVRCLGCGKVQKVTAAERLALCPKAPGREPDYYEIDGDRLTIYEIAAKYGIDRRTIYTRMEAGWTLEKAVSVPTANLLRKSATAGN